jgi:NAD(P) transhydrogenase subunit alpha
MAAENGGNCELTEAGTTQVVNNVKIIGPVNLPSKVPHHASQLYAKNVENLLKLLINEGEANFNFEDEIILNTTITHQGKIISPMLKGDSE